MQTTIAAAYSAFLAVVLVDVLDLGYNAKMTTVMLEFNSSCRRSLKEYSNEIDTNFNSLKKEINKSCSTLHINFNECKADLKKMIFTMLDFNSSCSQSVKKYSYKVSTSVNSLKQEMNESYSTLQTNLNKCFRENEIWETEIKNITSNKDVLWYLLTLLGVGEMGVTIFLVCVVRKLNALRLSGNEVLSLKPTDWARKQLNSDKRVKEAGSLRRSIAVICFNDTRMTFYRDLMGDITSGMETGYHSVSGKKDTLQIRSKVAVLFVERNDRHIILESEHEIGDLKVSCVRYIQQNGGNVIVVYCGHKESDSMGDLLCSPNLTSADRHRELRALKDENCFLSINKTFSQTQKNHLNTKLKEYLDSN